MCIEKLRALFCKNKKNQNYDVQLQALREQDFQNKVQEIASAIILVDQSRYLKASDVLLFMGCAPIEQILQDEIISEQIKDALICCKLKKNVGIDTQFAQQFYTKVPFSTKMGPEIRYAFNENITTFLAQTYKNDKNVPYLISVLKYVFENIDSIKP